MNVRKSALVTGASSGIGYATAIELAKRGYLVFAGARRLEMMKPLESLGIIIIELDVTSDESVNSARDFISNKTNGMLDLLYNNAGAQCVGPAIEIDHDKVMKCFEVNVFGTMRVVRAFSPLVIKSGGGLIAFTGSTSGLGPFPFSSTYAASKGAIHSYVSTLALELMPFNVKVLNVITGGVKTEIGDSFHLSADSLYRIEQGEQDSFAEMLKMRNLDGREEPGKYAENVVNDFEKSLAGGDAYNANSETNFNSNFGVTYRGSGAGSQKWTSVLAPRWYVERGCFEHFHLREYFTKLYKQNIREAE